MLNELKDILVPRVVSALGPRSKREREREREREKEKGEGRESRPDQGLSLSLLL